MSYKNVSDIIEGKAASHFVTEAVVYVTIFLEYGMGRSLNTQH